MLGRNKYLIILSLVGCAIAIGVSYFIGFAGPLVVLLGSILGLVGHHIDSKDELNY